MSILSQDFSVVIDRRIRAPGHVREVLDGLNEIEKRFLFKLMSTVKFPGEKVMTYKWLCKMEPVHLMLVYPEKHLNACLMRHANME